MSGFINLEELEERAKSKLPRMVYDYYSGGANSQWTVAENRRAFNQYRLLPRMLVDVSKLDLTSQVLGYKTALPMMIAPMAMHGMAHPERELATARAAAAAGIPMVVSTMATSSIAEVAATGHPCLIFQLYVIKNRQVVKSWVQEAEALGYKAIMITVDAQRLGYREADERNRFQLPEGLHLKNLERLRHTHVTQARDGEEGSGLHKLFACEVDDSLTWDFIPWLRSITKLPVYLKGLLSPDDALLAVQHGVDAIIVSNHGGRQLDYAPAAIDMLPAVCAAVAGRAEVWVDGGIRRGTDVLKALALGARGVLLGRPVLYGLALEGQQGVEKVVAMLGKEFEMAMALAGCAKLQDISPRLLLRPGEVSCWGSSERDKKDTERGAVVRSKL